jgi:hypothetical protein
VQEFGEEEKRMYSDALAGVLAIAVSRIDVVGVEDAVGGRRDSREMEGEPEGALTHEKRVRGARGARYVGWRWEHARWEHARLQEEQTRAGEAELGNKEVEGRGEVLDRVDRAVLEGVWTQAPLQYGADVRARYRGAPAGGGRGEGGEEGSRRAGDLSRIRMHAELLRGLVVLQSSGENVRRGVLDGSVRGGRGRRRGRERRQAGGVTVTTLVKLVVGEDKEALRYAKRALYLT